MLEKIMSLDWIMIFGFLFALSEALAMLPFIKANSIFQAIYNGIKFVKEKLLPKKAE